MVQRFVQSTVRDGLHASLRESQVAMANDSRERRPSEQPLSKIGQARTAALKEGMQQLLRRSVRGEAARRTVEDQLRELGEQMGFDFMLVSATDGSPSPELYASTRVRAGASSYLWIPTLSITAMQISGFWAGAFFRLPQLRWIRTMRILAPFPSASTLTSRISQLRSRWCTTERSSSRTFPRSRARDGKSCWLNAGTSPNAMCD